MRETTCSIRETREEKSLQARAEKARSVDLRGMGSGFHAAKLFAVLG